MLPFKAGRTKTASLRKVKKLHEVTGRPAASKGQESWKPRKAAPGWAVMEGMLWARKCTEGTGKPRSIKTNTRPMSVSSLKHNFNHRWKQANILFQVTASPIKKKEKKRSQTASYQYDPKTLVWKTCSVMSCKNSEQKVRKAPCLGLIVVFPQSWWSLHLCVLAYRCTEHHWNWGSPVTSLGQAMALLCLSVKGSLHQCCNHQKSNSNNTTNKNTDQASLRFITKTITKLEKPW